MSTNKPPEVKKMKQGMSYSKKEKTIIMNVFKYFLSQYPEQNVTEIVRRTAKATGCSEKSIFSFRKEEVSPQGFKEPSKTKIRKNINTNNRLVKYDEGVRESIKNVIYDLKSKNIVPSLSIIMKNISSNNLPSFSIMTLRRLLYDMGFYYEKSGNKSVLMERGVTASTTPRDLNKPVLNKPSEHVNSLQENSRAQYVPNIATEKESSVNSQLSNDVDRDVNLIKLGNEKLQAYSPMNVHQTHRIQALGSYQENHFPHLGPPNSSHMPVMFPPRIPPYPMHSTLPHPYSSNMDVHMKRHGAFMSPHHPQLPPQNVVMH